jgi:hypothetical protein
MPSGCSSPAASSRLATVAACIVVILILILAIRWCAGAPPGHGDTFYTSAATEEPTRSYTPYVGTIPNGAWGISPWALGPGVGRPSRGLPDMPSLHASRYPA